MRSRKHHTKDMPLNGNAFVKQSNVYPKQPPGFLLISLQKTLCMIMFFTGILFTHPHVFVDAKADIFMKKNKILKIQIQWTFDKLTSAQSLNAFDKNTNGTFEKEEIKILDKTVFRNLNRYHFYTYIKTDGHSVKIRPVDFSASINDEQEMVYRFTALVNKNFKNNAILQFYDETIFVDFSYSKENTQIHYNASAGIPHPHATNIQERYRPAVLITAGDDQQNKARTTGITAIKKSLFRLYDRFKKIQKKLNNQVSEATYRLKSDKSPKLFVFTSFLLFIYGIVHAIGPGHGKSILSAWFFGEEVNQRELFTAAAAGEILHAFSAVTLTAAGWFFLKHFMPDEQTLKTILTKIAAVLILSVALKNIFSLFNVKQKKQKSGVKKPQTHLVAASIGVVPCPVSSVIFIFALRYNIPLEGLFFILCFASGMTATAFGISFLLDRFKSKIKKAKNHEKIFKKLAVVSNAALILFAGFLFF